MSYKSCSSFLILEKDKKRILQRIQHFWASKGKCQDLTQSWTHCKGVFSKPQYMAGFCRIPLAAITPSTFVTVCISSTSCKLLMSPLAITGMLRLSLIVFMASLLTGSARWSFVRPWTAIHDTPACSAFWQRSTVSLKKYIKFHLKSWTNICKKFKKSHFIAELIE